MLCWYERGEWEKSVHRPWLIKRKEVLVQDIHLFRLYDDQPQLSQGSVPSVLILSRSFMGSAANDSTCRDGQHQEDRTWWFCCKDGGIWLLIWLICSSETLKGQPVWSSDTDSIASGILSGLTHWTVLGGRDKEWPGIRPKSSFPVPRTSTLGTWLSSGMKLNIKAGIKAPDQKVEISPTMTSCRRFETPTSLRLSSAWPSLFYSRVPTLSALLRPELQVFIRHQRINTVLWIQQMTI